MALRILVLSILTMLATACSPARDNAYRVGGAGLDLHTDQTEETTANLKSYFENLCAQAGYEDRNCAPAPTVSNDPLWSLLVETGYNDIDARCDQYLKWIDSKRTERMLVEGTGTAVGTLLSGVLGIADAGASTIAYTSLALGFSRATYDNYNTSILLGLEGSTIKEIVRRQRDAHRKEFAKRNYQTRPQAVFALRRYLMFCTPQTILTDVNSFSREAASGNNADIATKANAAAQTIPPADTPAAPPVRNNQDLRTGQNAAQIFEGDGFTDRHVRIVQTGACLSVDGKVGPRTKAAVRIIEDSYGSQMNQNGKFSNAEWSLAEQRLSAKCPDKLLNFFEAQTFGSGSDPYGHNLVLQLIAKNKLPSTLGGKDLRDTEVRDAVAGLRSSEPIAESYPGYDVRNQVTPKFVRHFGL